MFNGLQFVVIMLFIVLKLFSRSLAKTFTMTTAFVRGFNSPKIFFFSPLCARERHELHTFLLKESFTNFSYLSVVVLSAEGLFIKRSRR